MIFTKSIFISNLRIRFRHWRQTNFIIEQINILSNRDLRLSRGKGKAHITTTSVAEQPEAEEGRSIQAPIDP